MAEGSDTPASVPDYILDEVPPLHEIVEYARTDCCIELGTMLELDIEDLRNVKKTESSVSAELSAVYQMWLDKKGRDATRRRLLDALRTKHVGQDRIAELYKAKLIEMAEERKNIENKQPNIMEKNSSNFKKSHHRNPEKERKERDLKRHFRNLLSAVYLSSDKHIDTRKLKLHIQTWLAVEKEEVYLPATIEEFCDKIESKDTSSTIILFLVKKYFIHYRNPQLLKEIVEKFLLIDDNVVTQMNQYIHDLEAFELTLKELEQVSREDDLGPSAPSGLPEFTIEADNPEMTLQQFQTTLSENIPESNHTLLKSVEPGSIIMTYVALPCVASAVMKELTNPITLKKLNLKGVRVIKPYPNEHCYSPQRTICAKEIDTEKWKLKNPRVVILETKAMNSLLIQELT